MDGWSNNDDRFGVNFVFTVNSCGDSATYAGGGFAGLNSLTSSIGAPESEPAEIGSRGT